MRYAQRAMRKFIPVMKNDKLNLWRAVYAERCKYGFRREYGAVEVGDRLCLPHENTNVIIIMAIPKMAAEVIVALHCLMLKFNSLLMFFSMVEP